MPKPLLIRRARKYPHLNRCARTGEKYRLYCTVPTQEDPRNLVEKFNIILFQLFSSVEFFFPPGSGVLGLLELFLYPGSPGNFQRDGFCPFLLVPTNFAPLLDLVAVKRLIWVLLVFFLHSQQRHRFLFRCRENEEKLLTDVEF